jgi:hypothetical protein
VTRDEFAQLPPTIALRLLWDSLQLDAKLAHLEPPRAPLPPKYDMRIYRKGGHCWASECDLKGLLYWHGKAVESAESGSQYAAKDKKKAASLERWIAWRNVEPAAVWTGTRDDSPATALAPSSHPEVYSRDAPPTAAAPDEDFGEIPF